MKILCPGCKSYSKMYGTEPGYNDPRHNDIPDIAMRMQWTERKIFPDITISLSTQSQFKQNIEFNTVIENL